uniref:Uncharacterized protein n=1 Tax=Magallana gigas TaxID=29159 RepID=A0A8W8MKY3_MAGGI
MAGSNQVKNFAKNEDINEYSPIFDEFTTEWIGDQEFSVASFNEGDFMGKEGTNRKRKLEVDFSCEGQSQTKKPRLSEENLILSTFRAQKFWCILKANYRSSHERFITIAT